MIELLRTRRSIRNFTGQAIEPEKMEMLKEAVLRSPSSRNLDPWEFLFVTDRTVLGKLARCKPHGAGFLAEAALGIVVGGDSNESDTWIEDCAIASILAQMTALSLGLGSCWIQIRDRMHDQTQTAQSYMAGLLQLPPGVMVEAMVAIGYPAETKPPRPGAELPYSQVHGGVFGTSFR